jgi:hypothetical protein
MNDNNQQADYEAMNPPGRDPEGPQPPRPGQAGEEIDLTPEDEEILDRVWDEIGREEAAREEQEQSATQPPPPPPPPKPNSGKG